MYWIESSSPFEPGARPSNSSEASILIWASNPSAVMASSAGFSRSVSESAANPISTNDRTIRMAMIFIYFFCSGGLRPSQLGASAVRDRRYSSERNARSKAQLFVSRRRGSGGIRLTDPDLFQKWLHRLFASEKLFNRFVDIARIAHCVNFISQPHSCTLVVITLRRAFKDRCHVGGDRIGPGITVVAGIVAIKISKVGDEGRARVDRKKHLF